MTTLTEFLQAWLAEDEQAAREAADHDSGRWFMGDKWNIYRAESEVDEVDGTVTHDLIAWGNAKPQSEHIARHDPARTLAEVEAKRARLAFAVAVLTSGIPGVEPSGDPDIDAAGLMAAQAMAKIYLKIEALPYADHVDYREDLTI